MKFPVNIHSRPALVGSLLSAAVLLAACGGGGDALVSSPANPGAVEATQQADAAFRPAAWELQADAATEEAFLASAALQQRERPLALADSRVKWNPGHYVALGGGSGDFLIKNTLNEIAPYPQVKGLLTRYLWRELETDKGVYDFSRIDAALAAAAAKNKRLFILVGTKVFKAGARALPDYMHTDEYEGGVFRVRIDGKDTLGTEATTGENIALWDNDVRDRLIALMQALAARYNLHNSFEGVTFNETALGDAVVPLTSEQKTGFFNNLALVGAATRQAFPNSVVMQFINFPRPYMPGLVSSMVAGSVSLGGPDTLLTDYDLNTYIYPLYDNAKNKVAIGPSVQAENYVTTYQNGPYAPPAIADLYGFARNRLGATHLFWSKTLTEPLVPYANVLKFFASSALPKDAAGGLNAACPTTFVSCTPKL